MFSLTRYGKPRKIGCKQGQPTMSQRTCKNICHQARSPKDTKCRHQRTYNSRTILATPNFSFSLFVYPCNRIPVGYVQIFPQNGWKCLRNVHTVRHWPNVTLSKTTTYQRVIKSENPRRKASLFLFLLLLLFLLRLLSVCFIDFTFGLNGDRRTGLCRC